jgi:hypothetical protein
MEWFLSNSGRAEQTRRQACICVAVCPLQLTLDRMPSRQLTPKSRSRNRGSARASLPSKLQRSVSCEQERLHQHQAEHECSKSGIAPIEAGYPIIMPTRLPIRPPFRRSSACCRDPDAIHHGSHRMPAPPLFAPVPGIHADNWIGRRMANMYAPLRSISSSDRH